MDSGSSFSSNWNNLPNEIKIKIIHELDNNTRLSLRVCSVSDYQLVDSTVYRIVHELCLRNDSDENWIIDIVRNTYSGKVSFVFESFEDFQHKLTDEIENCDCITFLKADSMDSKQLKFKKSGKLLKVRELIFKGYKEGALDVVLQMDPSHLKHMQLHDNGVRNIVLETPQAKQVHFLSAYGYDVTDDQLLKMENPELFLGHTNHVTLAGINKYIKKCCLTLDNQPIYFRIEYRGPKKNIEELLEGIDVQKIVPDPSNPLIKRCYLNSSSEKYQLEVKFCYFYIETKTIGKNGQVGRLQNPEPWGSFKSVNCINISPNRLIITGRNTAPVHYIYDSIDEMQKKLIEEMNKLDYIIKRLEVYDTSRDWILCPPNKQVTIGNLSVHSGSISPEFLRQIEPVQLKQIELHGLNNDARIYDTPQVINAQKLEIAYCNIQDQQLINTNAINIIFKRSQVEHLTDSGINKFIKKILKDLNRHDYNFEICHLKARRYSVDILQNLSISSKERVNRHAVKWIVNSKFPGFKLELSKTRESISGKRITVADNG